MGKLARYFWPKCGLLFYMAQERIEAAFGFFEKGSLQIELRRTFSPKEKEELFDWYRQIRQTYPRLYVVSMMDTFNQGALPGCGSRTFEKYGIDEALSRHICFQKQWSAYVSLVEIKWFEEKFKGIELDLLYSPFILLYQHVYPHLDETPGIYILHQNSMLYMMVLSKDRLWYAHATAVLHSQAQGAVEAGLDTDEADDLAFDLELLEEEEGAEILENNMIKKSLKEEGIAEEEADRDDLALLEYNLNLYEEVKETIGRYYRDDRYEQTFIQKAMLYDTEGKVNDFTRYVKDELFMPAEKEIFDPIDAMARLAVKEVGG